VCVLGLQVDGKQASAHWGKVHPANVFENAGIEDLLMPSVSHDGPSVHSATQSESWLQLLWAATKLARLVWSHAEVVAQKQSISPAAWPDSHEPALQGLLAKQSHSGDMILEVSHELGRSTQVGVLLAMQPGWPPASMQEAGVVPVGHAPWFFGMQNAGPVAVA
jgi:hypothetical protein